MMNYHHLKTLREAAKKERQGEPVTAGEMKPLWRTLLAVAAAFVIVFSVLVVLAVVVPR